jgi:hypothetical protein
LEVPITLVPIVGKTPQLIDRLAALAPPTWGARVRSLFRYGGVVGVQPAMYPLASLQLAAYLHRRRGGRVLTMYFHSSELKPETNPLFPTEAAVNRFVDKIRTFLTWLVQTGPVEGVTLAALGADWQRTGRLGSGQAVGTAVTGGL